MLESVAKLTCCDCQRTTNVVFVCALLKGKRLTLTSFAKCEFCLRTKNDNRSLQGHLEIDREDIYEAIKNGLFVLAIP